MNEAAESPGGRLKAERERKGFSTQKAADQLHLDAWVIEALESGDYARIGPSVYGKGHLKRYAGLLGLPEEEIIGAYETRRAAPAEAALAESALAPALRMPSAQMQERAPPRATVAGVVALSLLAAASALLWRPWHARHAAAAAAAAAAASLAAPATIAPPALAADITTSAATSAARAVPVTAGRLEAPAVASAEPAAGTGHARLRLSFSADSWVDVHDASGRRLFAGRGLANNVKIIAGEAPMKIYLGFASGVQLEINNRVVAIGPQFVAGDVARFDAGADGVLRRDVHAAAAADPRPRG